MVSLDTVDILTSLYVGIMNDIVNVMEEKT